MEYVYHGSKTQNIKELIPRESTHGTYVYATSDRTVATVMAGVNGGDIIYYFGRQSKDEPWNLVERVPEALEKVYSNSFSIYTLDSSDFKDINTGFQEVVSDHPVQVLYEEKYENVFDEIKKLEEEGKVNVYRYPNKPEYLPNDDSDLFEKFKKWFGKKEKDDEKLYECVRWIFLHPNLKERIEEFAYELGYELPEYEEIKDCFIDLQMKYPDKEFFVEEGIKAQEYLSGRTR